MNLVLANKIQPKRGTVLVRMLDRKVFSLLHIPESFTERPTDGIVIAVGEKPRTLRDVEVDHEVFPGDRVFIPVHTGQELTIAGIPHKLVAEWQIPAVLEEA